MLAGQQTKFRFTAIIAAALLASCGEKKSQAPTAPGADRMPEATELLMKLDGIEIHFGEVIPHLAILNDIGPEWATKVKFRRVLEEYTIPLRLAQRDFAPQRAEQLALARSLKAICSNIYELEQHGQHLLRQRKFVTRRSVELPIAAFLFDELLTGSVSEPIEIPHGFVVAAAHEVKHAALLVDDVADAVQVGFLTHSPADWTSWLSVAQSRVADKLNYVHPDYRDYLPEWIQLP